MVRLNSNETVPVLGIKYHSAEEVGSVLALP
jgi:hypothetical protein